MRRRDTLRRGAVLGATGSLGLLAGCSGGGEETESTSPASLSVESFDYQEGDSGNLVVSVTVANAGAAEGTGRLYVTATAAEPTTSATADSTSETASASGDGTVAARKYSEVTVPAGETRTVTLAFEFAYDQFSQQGSLDVNLRT